MRRKKSRLLPAIILITLLNSTTTQAAKIYLATVDLLPFGIALHLNLRSITEKYGLVHSEIIVADSFDPRSGRFDNISKHWSWGYSPTMIWRRLIDQRYNLKQLTSTHVMNEINNGRAIQVMEAVNLTSQEAWAASDIIDRYTKNYFYQVFSTNCNQGCTRNLLLAQQLSSNNVYFRILWGPKQGCDIASLQAIGAVKQLSTEFLQRLRASKKNDCRRSKL